MSCLTEIPGLQNSSPDGGLVPEAGDAGYGDAEAAPDLDGYVEAPSDVTDSAAPDSEAGPPCENGKAECDGDPSNGCEDLSTDSKHCGACGRDCLGGVCNVGTCEPVILAEDVGLVFAMVMADGYLFGTTWDGSVWKVPVQGCGDPAGCAAYLSVGEQDLRDMAVKDGFLYYTNNGASSLRRIGSDGTGACDVATELEDPAGVAVDDTHVYWSERAGNVVKRAPKGCFPTAVEVIVPNTPTPWMLALDDTGLYWTNRSGDLVSWASATGKEAGVVWSGATPGDCLFGLALDDAWVYWRDGEFSPGDGTGRVVRAPKDRSGNMQVLAENQSEPRTLAVDSTSAYWTVPEAVRVVKKSGGSVRTLASGFNSPHGIVVDAKAVYFGTFWGKQVVKVAHFENE